MMELSSHEEEAEIPMPINSAFVGLHMHAHHGHGHMIHHHHHHGHDPSSSSSHTHHNIIPLNNNGTSTITTNTSTTPILEEYDQPHHATLDGNTMNNDDDHDDNGKMNDDGDGDGDDDDDDMCMKKKNKKVRYKECQKNHAASMGGNAKDGCGEFMPSGEQGSLEYFICSACNCHRNFHRKEIEGEHLMMIHHGQHPHSQFYPPTTHPHLLGSRGRKVILGGATVGHQPRVPFSRSLAINLPYTLVSSDHQSDHHGTNGSGGMMMMNNIHHHHGNNNNNQVVKKRFRTKFSQEQKEKMHEFAEKVGWKIQKQEESVVQQFCQQIGIKRRVLKVWMHNNKHNLAKKNDDNNIINHSNHSS